jgi:hypothetical protein
LELGVLGVHGKLVKYVVHSSKRKKLKKNYFSSHKLPKGPKQQSTSFWSQGILGVNNSKFGCQNSRKFTLFFKKNCKEKKESWKISIGIVIATNIDIFLSFILTYSMAFLQHIFNLAHECQICYQAMIF